MDSVGLMVGLVEEVREGAEGEGVAALGAAMVARVRDAFREVEGEAGGGQLVAATLEALSAVLASSPVSPQTDQGRLLETTITSLHRCGSRVILLL